MVAWYDSAIAPAGVYATSLAGGNVLGLTPVNCNCYSNPILQDRTVVFPSWHRGPRDIWAVNIDTADQTNLSDHPAPQFEPDFDGNWVVWTDGRNDPTSDPYGSRHNSDIYGRRLSGGSVEALCTDPSTQLHPNVGSGLVAWEDFRNSGNPNDAWSPMANIDIYLLDLASRREIQVTSASGMERHPRIVGRKLYYVAEDRQRRPAVFVVDLSFVLD